VLLVRHGATDWNRERLAQGQADIPLNRKGRRQARKTAAMLSSYDIAAVYASDLQRAIDTARPIATRHEVELVTDPAFREIDQGEWEGVHTDEIRRRWPELWGPARHVTRRPGGESPEEVTKRGLEGLRRVLEAHPSKTVAVVSHGGTIRWLVAAAKGYGVAGSQRLRGLSNGGVIAVKAEWAGDGIRFGGVERLDGASPDLDDPNQ
jgi:broad specificity phosphatase PhoE